MLILSDDDNPVGHRHFDFIMVVPMVGISVSQVIHVVVMFARCSNALRYAHLFAYVLHVVALLENGILLESIRKGWTRHDDDNSIEKSCCYF